MRYSLVSVDKKRGDAHTVRESSDFTSLKRLVETFTPNENEFYLIIDHDMSACCVCAVARPHPPVPVPKFQWVGRV